MEKENYSPANVYELLSWSDWNGKDWVAGLGSIWMSRFGVRHGPFLGRDGSRRGLRLFWGDPLDEWLGGCRFLAVSESEMGIKEVKLNEKEVLKIKLGAVELAERIVIEYANLSGRESDHRSFVRQAALKVLEMPSDFRDEARKVSREQIY